MNIDKSLDSAGPWLDLIGRLLIAAIFLLTGLEKIDDFTGTQEFMMSKGVPGAILPLVIALEIGGAAAIILGWKTRITALLLATFTLLAALLFHTDFSNHMQYLSFLKNLGIAGGFLFLVVNGSGRISIEAKTKES